jgi:methionine synthase II (cobalamin-independent)
VSRIDAPVLLTGSVPLSSAEEVLAVLGDELGDLLAAYPDGETGYRTNWTSYQAYFVHHPHPDLETLLRPADVGGVPQWSPSGFPDLWNFRVRHGVEKVGFGDLYYAEAALRSYVPFRDLRDAGRLPAGARFQVSLPTAPGAIYAFFRADSSDYERLREGYEAALAREIGRILSVIPAGDLAVQWDVCMEVMDNEGAFPWMSGPPAAWHRFEQAVRATGSAVPGEVAMGYHLCYGDLGGHHIIEPKDLRLLTNMANAVLSGVGRDVDWFHMPVPIGRSDPEYFAPLADLEAGEAALYLGLIHRGDGVEGAARRIEAARRHVQTAFGVATECGFGRLPSDAVIPLLRLHRDVAELLRTP